jgi:hypothetical protein
MARLCHPAVALEYVRRGSENPNVLSFAVSIPSFRSLSGHTDVTRITNTCIIAEQLLRDT